MSRRANPGENTIETVLLSQWRAPSLAGPLVRLALAAMEGAVRDSWSRNKRVSAEAREWVETDAGDTPFGLPWTCDVLRLDLAAMRVRLRGLMDGGRRNQRRDVNGRRGRIR